MKYLSVQKGNVQYMTRLRGSSRLGWRGGSELLRIIVALSLFGMAQVQGSAAAATAHVQGGYGQLPLHFEPNYGQTDAQVLFLSRGSGYSLFLTATEAVLSFASTQGTPRAQRKILSTGSPSPVVSVSAATVLRMKLVGAHSHPHVKGLAELPGKSNYFLGNDPTQWRANVPTYAKVKYEGVYPGVDLVYYGQQRQLEYDFVVAPGADPQVIVLGFEGVDNVEVDAQHDLVLHTNGGHIRLHRPFIYQEIEGVRHPVIGAYVLKGPHQVGFQVATYDTTKPLVIDPVLIYSTYLGGSDFDRGIGIAADASGNAYVMGVTASTNFPTANAAQPSLAGSTDVFVTKLNPTGSALIYSTFLGGADVESGNGEGGIAVDTSGNVYVTGVTHSTNFPTVNPLQGPLKTAWNIFIAKLNATGSALVYSTYLGGRTGHDYDSSIAVDASGSAYVAGFTDETDFPTVNAVQPVYGGGSDGDGFVAKLNPTGSALIYSTYLGGSGSDIIHSIAADSAGNAYVTGETASTDFPMVNALQLSLAGRGDCFVAKLNPSGSAFVYSTYLGGSAVDMCRGIATNAQGNAYVTGFTQSADFPTTPGAFDTTCGTDGACDIQFGSPRKDAFVTKLNPTGSALVYSTFLGGSGSEESRAIAVDVSGNAYITGDIVVGTDRYQVLKLDPTGSQLIDGAFVTGGVVFVSIAVDPFSNAYVTGSASTTGIPTTHALQRAYGGGPEDAFVAKIELLDTLADLVLAKTDSPDPVLVGANLTYTVTVTNNGPSSATDIIMTDTLPIGVIFVSASASQGSCTGTSTVTCALGNLADGASATVTITVRPTAAGTLSNTASVDGNESDPNTANNTDTETTTVSAVADLALTKTDAPDPVLAGQTLTYTLTATNSGPSGATGVTVSDTLPSGVTFVSASASCSGTTTITCNIGNLANGGSATVTITVQPTAAGTLTNTASVQGIEADPTIANNTATASTIVSPAADLAITKADAPDPVQVGQTLTYTLTATNSGPSGATGVTVSDTLPSGVTLVSASASQGSCSGTSTVTCSLGNLANGASATITIVVRPKAGGGTTITNTAGVQGNEADPTTANNTATAVTTVNAGAGATVTVVATDPNAGEADSDPGVFTVTRSGSTASDLIVNFTVGGTATQGTDYNVIGTTVTISMGQASAMVTITPILDAAVEGSETVILTLAAGAGYAVGSPNTATVTIAESDIWVPKAPMPTARFRLGVASASNGKLYAIGGTDGLGALSDPQAKNQEYDPATDTWTTKKPMPTARDGLGVAAANNGKLYAIGGDNDQIGLTTNQEYDPATDTWTTKKPMPTARTSVAVAAASNGKVYAIGGALSSNAPDQNTVEEYDPATNTWTTKKPMRTARSGLGLAAASNGKLYAIGGSSNGNVLKVVEEYDPATNTWTTKAPMLTARAALAVMAAPNGKLYAIGGVNNSNTALKSVEEYDPATNTWTTKKPMPTARKSLGGASAPNGKLYAIGGITTSGKVLSTVEEYTPPQ